MHARKDAGFTLIEMLLSLALFSIIASMSYAVHVNVSQEGEMNIAVHSVESLLRKAIALSSAVEGDSRWGVQLDQPFTTLFKGDSFETRDEAYDENLELPNFELSGQLEYVFERVSGNPLSAGAVEFTNEYTGEVRSISVNEKGQISIE